MARVSKPVQFGNSPVGLTVSTDPELAPNLTISDVTGAEIFKLTCDLEGYHLHICDGIETVALQGRQVEAARPA